MQHHGHLSVSHAAYSRRGHRRISQHTTRCIGTRNRLASLGRLRRRNVAQLGPARSPQPAYRSANSKWHCAVKWAFDRLTNTQHGSNQGGTAGMVKRYHESFPSFSYEFDSRYPLQFHPKIRLTAAIL